MTTITGQTQYTDVFSSFNERKLRYAQPQNFRTQKGNTEAGDRYIDRYVKVVKNHPKSFTAAGIITLLVGGTSVFRNKNAMRQGFNTIKENVSNPNRIGYGIFNFDSYKNMFTAMLLENRFTGKVGKKLFEWSKISLKVTGGQAKKGYKSWSSKVVNLERDVKKTIATNSVTKEEREVLKNLKKLMDDEKLVKLANDLETGFEKRSKTLRTEIEKRHIQPFKDKYIPSFPTIKSLFSWKHIKSEFRKVKNNLQENGLFEKELVRDGWEKTLDDVLETRINKAGNGNAEKTMEEFKAFYEKMAKIKNPSKDFEKIMNQLKTKEDLSLFKIRNFKDFKELLSKKGIIDGFKEVKNFEINRYAGREIDLAGGGGVPEFIMPAAVGVPLTYSIVKDSEPGERTKTFMKKGGIAFVGGLGIWSMVAVLKGINGLRGILIGAGSGFAIDQISKIVCKFKKNGKNPQFAQKQAEQISPKTV